MLFKILSPLTRSPLTRSPLTRSPSPFFPSIFSPSTLAILVSALIAGWMFWGGPSINTDGVLYLSCASEYLQHGFAGAVKIYGWPFYSILIAMISLSGMSLEMSAAFLNAILYTILAWAFVSAAKELYPGRIKLHYLAAAVVLLEPYINSLRYSFFRDSGHIAFMLLSLLALLRYARTNRPLSLAAWATCAVVAALFRPEAIILLPASIAAIMYNRDKWKLGLILFIGFLLFSAVSIYLLLHYAPESRVRDLLQWWSFYSLDLKNTFVTKSALLEKTILGVVSSNGTEALAAALVVTLLAAIIGVLTPVHCLILWIGRKQPLDIAPPHKRILAAYAIACLIPPILFVVQAYFLSGRYLLAFGVVLLLLAPARLAGIVERIRAPYLRAGTVTILILFFVISSYRNLKIASELKDAGVWLATQSGSVWTNSIPVGYYVRAGGPNREVITEDIGTESLALEHVTSEWAAVLVPTREKNQVPAILQKLHGTEQKRFEGRGRFVVIVKR